MNIDTKKSCRSGLKNLSKNGWKKWMHIQILISAKTKLKKTSRSSSWKIKDAIKSTLYFNSLSSPVSLSVTIFLKLKILKSTGKKKSKSTLIKLKMINKVRTNNCLIKYLIRSTLWMYKLSSFAKLLSLEKLEAFSSLTSQEKPLFLCNISTIGTTWLNKAKMMKNLSKWEEKTYQYQGHLLLKLLSGKIWRSNIPTESGIWYYLREFCWHYSLLLFPWYYSLIISSFTKNRIPLLSRCWWPLL